MDTLFPPGPQKSLLLGNVKQFKDDPLAALLHAAHDYGDTVHFRFGPAHVYLLTNPGDAHGVLVERANQFTRKHSLLHALNSAMGHDLFAPEEKINKRQRRKQLFNPRWLDVLVEDAAQISARALDAWRGGDPLDLLKPLTLQISAQMLFGEPDDRSNSFAHRLEQVIFATRDDCGFQSPLKMPLWVPTAQNRQRRDALNELRRTVNEIVADHRARGRYSVLACLLQGAETENLARKEMQELFYAGSEAAAHTLAWAWALLAQHPEVAETLEAEIDTVLGGRLPTAADLAQLPYTEMILKETLRLYPPVWLISRQAKAETRIGDYFVPSGSTIFVSPYIIQHSPRYFVSPEKFLPERFSDSSARRGSSSAYLPFAYTIVEHDFMMTCAKLVLAAAAQRFRPSLATAQASTQPVTAELGISLRPRGLRLDPVPRAAL